jgi:hypothetical protein
MDETKVLTLPDGRRFLKLDSAFLLTQLAELKKGTYYGAAIGRIHGYELDDIDRLGDLQALQGIHIQDPIADLSALNRLKGLKYILVTSPKQKVDFSAFPLLEELRIGEWNSNAAGVDRCERLRRLHVRNFAPPDRTLTILAAPKLREFEVVQSPLTSLAGLGHFAALEALMIHYMTKLVDISDLAHVKSSLRKLVVEQCKKIQGWHVIGELRELKNLLIRTSSDIPSVDFVSRLTKLETIGVLDTNVKDGKLDPLVTSEHLTFVGITDKKHYSHKDAELKKLLQTRRVRT